MRRILVGLGNPFGGDDAVGLRVAELLGGSAWEVHACSAPENVLGALALKDPEVLVLVDAADMGLPPGSIRRLPPTRPPQMLGSAHGLPLPFLLSLLASRVENLVVIGIQPKHFGPTQGLSPEVAQAAQELAALLLKGEIRSIPEL